LVRVKVGAAGVAGGPGTTGSLAAEGCPPAAPAAVTVKVYDVAGSRPLNEQLRLAVPVQAPGAATDGFEVTE
jgi:hypothetical protein